MEIAIAARTLALVAAISGLSEVPSWKFQNPCRAAPGLRPWARRRRDRGVPFGLQGLNKSKTGEKVDGTAQGQDSDGGRRGFDRAGLGQRQGDRGDLCARGRAGVLRRSQRGGAEETVNIITAEGGKAAAFTADVSRAADVEAMVAACLKAYGRIDVLDNNVGIAEMGSVVEVTEVGMGPRVRGQPQERLPRHEARHSRDAEAGRRLDHQHFLDRLDPPSRHFLCQLRRVKGGDEPDDEDHGGAIRAATMSGSTPSCRA